MTYFKVVYQIGSDKPREKKYDTNSDEFFMDDMKHNVNSIEYSIKILKFKIVEHLCSLSIDFTHIGRRSFMFCFSAFDFRF